MSVTADFDKGTQLKPDKLDSNMTTKKLEWVDPNIMAGKLKSD